MKQPMGNRPAREDSLKRAPWNSKTVAEKNITKEPTPSKPVVLDVEESSQSGSSCTSSKKQKTEVKSVAKYGHIKTDTDDNGDTVVHITIKSKTKDKKEQEKRQGK